MAHLRTITQEIFASGDYLTTANTLRTTIDASVQADPYKFYSYSQYQNSLTTAVSSGPSSIPGIQTLMNSRVSYLNSNSNYLLTAPVINTITTSNTNPSFGETIDISVTCSNEVSVYLGYRLEYPLRFNRIAMLDDGLHNDGAAGDHVYGASIQLNGPVLEYYIYAENNNAGLFEPQRAEHNYLTLNITLPLPNTGDVVINEILAENGVTVDNYGENDDWIELYNTTATTLNLTGLYLSDDISNLMKWQIPTGTTITPGQHLIVWTDNDSEQSGLHTNFKLSSGGESVILSDGSVIYDNIDFPSQTADISYARCPDAGAFTFTAPSYAASNNCELSVNEMSDEMSVITYPNPFWNKITLRFNADNERNITIADVQGKVVYSSGSSGSSIEINTENFTSGVFIVHVQEEGSQRTIKIMK